MYNAVNDTDYDDPNELEITTLDDDDLSEYEK